MFLVRFLILHTIDMCDRQFNGGILLTTTVTNYITDREDWHRLREASEEDGREATEAAHVGPAVHSGQTNRTGAEQRGRKRPE